MSERLAGILVSSFTRILIPGIKVTILIILCFWLHHRPFSGPGTDCQCKRTEAVRKILHMGLPRNPTYCTAVHHLLWPAVCRNYPGRFSIRCDCLCPEPWRLQR